MENICLRFPHIAKKVLQNVDNRTLVNFRNCSKETVYFINGEKFYLFQILQQFWLIVDSQEHGYQMSGSFPEYWKKILKNTPLENVEKIVRASIKFSTTFSNQRIIDWSPFHLAASFGNLELYKWMEEKCRELPLIESFEHMNSPVHMSADNGSLEIIKYLLKKLVNKNPRNKKGATPLHFAARNGNFDICLLLIANIGNEKNPRDNFGITPLHAAAYQGYLNICKVLVYNTTNKNPSDDRGRTPLHAAAFNGYLEICSLLVENTNEINPRDERGTTPVELAYQNGNFEICKLLIENIDNLDLPHLTMARTNLLFQSATDGTLVVYKSIVENIAEKIHQMTMEIHHFIWPHVWDTMMCVKL